MNLKPITWDEAAVRLQAGEIGVVPTDTVYGLVARAHDPKAVQRIFDLRRRETDKPLITLVGGMADLLAFGAEDLDTHKTLLGRVWPGPVSVIVSVSADHFDYIHRNTNSIAFRSPAHANVSQLIRRVGPLVAPSANLAGESVSRTLAEAYSYFGDDVFYVDGGEILGHPSALVDARQGMLRVLRPAPGFDISELL